MKLPLCFICLVLILFLSGCGGSGVTNSSNEKITGNFSGCAVGAFVGGLDNLEAFQSMIGQNLAVVHWYVHWQDPFPTAEANLVAASGSVPLITWEPWVSHTLGTLEAIASGSFEAYVSNFLLAAKNWGRPILLRFAHEMNGNWYPWDGSHNGAAAGPAKYQQAWRYIYNVRERVKASNVSLVWIPNNNNLPDAAWNEPANYYPGDQYVDWVGLDGYNWGYSAWEDFSAVFNSAYNQLITLTNKPLMIAEFASAGQGGSKAIWLSETLALVQTDYTRIKLLCYFNVNKERDWRLNSSPSAEAAFRSGISSSYFVQKML